MKKKFPFLDKQVSKKQTEDFISDFLKFGFFLGSPATRGGAAAKGVKGKKQVGKTKTKKEQKKQRISKEDATNFLRIQSRQQHRDILRNTLNKFGSRSKEFKQLKQLLTRATGRKNTNLLIKDVSAQERATVSLVKKKRVKIEATESTPTGPVNFEVISPTKTPEAFGVEFEALRFPGQLSQVGTLTGFPGSALNQQRVSDALKRNQLRIDRSRLSTSERLKQNELLGQKVSQKEQQQLKTQQQLKQQLKLGQQAKLTQSTKTLQRTAQALRTNQQLRQRTQQRVRGSRLADPMPRLRFPKPFAIKSEKRKVKTLVKSTRREAGYDTFLGKKGKRINKVPLKKNVARSLGAFVTDQTLDARFRIARAKRNAQKSQLNFPKKYYESTQNKFRQTKIKKGKTIFTPDRFIEKRNKRLDTLRERKKIQSAKLLSQIKKRTKKSNTRPFKKRVK